MSIFLISSVTFLASVSPTLKIESLTVNLPPSDLIAALILSTNLLFLYNTLIHQQNF
jgi:hypothetical protein